MLLPLFSRRPLRDGLSLRAAQAGGQAHPGAGGRRPLRDGLSLRGVVGTHGALHHLGRRPLRDGLSLRVHSARRQDPLKGSPSFTGRPFIEGSLWA